MNNLKKYFFVSSISSIFLLSSNALAFEQFITVKFKKNVSKEFIQEINSMTNTKVDKKLSNNSYKFKIGGVANKSTLDKYSEMFLIMKDVETVSPLPKDKIDDKINPFLYMNITQEQETNSNTNNNVTTNNQDNSLMNQVKDNPAPSTQTTTNTSTTVDENELKTTQIYNDVQSDLPPLEDISGNPVQSPNPNTNEPQILMQPVPNEFILKYRKGTSQEDIDLLNKGIGGNATYNKDTDTYKLTLPDYVDDSYAMSFYNNNQLIESVKQNEVKVDKKNQTTTKQNGANVQSGVAFALPLNGRDVKVTFKIGKQEKGVKWFEDVFDARIVSKKGFQTFTLRFPNHINPKFAARAVKACSIVQSSEVVSE